MRYMLLICADESGVSALSPAEGEAMIRQTIEANPSLGEAETLLAEIYRRKAAKDTA